MLALHCRQIWKDVERKLDNREVVRGVDLGKIDPIFVDDYMNKSIDIQQKSAMYEADVKLYDIAIYGLSDVFLDKANVFRDENLTDIAYDLGLGFPQIIINGTYSIKVSQTGLRFKPKM